jgi:hypothetical protein
MVMQASPWGILLLAIIAVGVIYLIVKAAQAAAERERQRKMALARWSSANGFVYSDGDPWNLDSRYSGVAEIGKGHNRFAYEVLSREQPVPSAIFRYQYRTWETRTVTRDGRSYTETYEETHYKRYLIVETAAQFPGLVIRPENLLDKIAGFVGFDDIDFESEEFSKRYFVKSADRQFAYAIIHPQMMEWMMTMSFHAELARGLLIMDVSTAAHTAQMCHGAWSAAAGFIERIPPFVWQDYGKRAPFRLPPPVAPPVSLEPSTQPA